MNQIAQIRQQLDSTRGTIDDVRRKAIQASPSGTLDFATTLAIGSLETFASQLDQEYRTAMSARDVEVVEFRLIGDEARNGSLPLDTLGSFATDLYKSLVATAAFKKTGRSPQRVRKQVQSEVEFQMSGIASGSTRIFVSGRSDVDIFGHSLAVDTLMSTFSLLEAGSKDEAGDALSEVGATGVRRFRDLLNQLVKKDLTMEVRWSDPENDEHIWSGTRDAIGTAVAVFGAATEAKTEAVEMQAIVEGINRRGRLELRRLTPGMRTEGPIFRVTYFYKDLDKVRPLRINDVVDVQLTKTSVRNQVTRRMGAAHYLDDLVLRTDVRGRKD